MCIQLKTHQSPDGVSTAVMVRNLPKQRLAGNHGLELCYSGGFRRLTGYECGDPGLTRSCSSNLIREQYVAILEYQFGVSCKLKATGK